MSKPIVIIESPFAGNLLRNLGYVRAAMRDCLLRGEAPYASHALYTQPGVLDDNDPELRLLGINAGFAFRAFASLTAVYTDLGISRGMEMGIQDAEGRGCPIEYRSLEEWKGYSTKDPEAFFREAVDLFERTTKGHKQPYNEAFAECLEEVCGNDDTLKLVIWLKIHKIGNEKNALGFSSPAEFLNSYARKHYLLKALRGGKK